LKFKQLIGQQEAILKIQEAIEHERMPHALLITGPQGVGELPFATAIAQYVNCLMPEQGDSCGRCSNCLKIQKGVHADIRYIYPIISRKEGGRQLLSQDFYQDFLSLYLKDPYMSQAQWQRALGGENKQLMISVHEVRELKRSIFLKAFEAPYKVVIFWQADLINMQGANAFLKLLEEPPDRTLLLLTSSQPDQLLNTILSRCQQLRLKRIDTDAIALYMTKEKELEAQQATEIAAIAEGSLGNALEMLEESTTALSEAYMQWMRAVYLGNYVKITDQLTPIVESSKEVQKLFLATALKKMRDALCFHLEAANLAYTPPQEQAFQQKFSQFVSPEKVTTIADMIEQSLYHITGNANARMTLTTLSLNMHQILRG